MAYFWTIVGSGDFARIVALSLGVSLSATMYTPPGYKKGDHVPVIIWAYPREFGDADTAGQVT